MATAGTVEIRQAAGADGIRGKEQEVATAHAVGMDAEDEEVARKLHVATPKAQVQPAEAAELIEREATRLLDGTMAELDAGEGIVVGSEAVGNGLFVDALHAPHVVAHGVVAELPAFQPRLIVLHEPGVEGGEGKLVGFAQIATEAAEQTAPLDSSIVTPFFTEHFDGALRIGEETGSGHVEDLSKTRTITGVMVVIDEVRVASLAGL